MADVQLQAASDGSYGACQKPASVRIARSGELPHDGALSRDGSVHVTDEARGSAAPKRSARRPPDARRPQVFNTASHLMAAMLALLGSAELIVKASEEASVSRPAVGVPHGTRGVGARCARSLPLLGAGASSNVLVRSRGAAQPGEAPAGGAWGRAAVFSCAPPAVGPPHARSAPARAVTTLENRGFLYLWLHPRQPVCVLHAAPRARGTARHGARPAHRRLLRHIPVDCRRARRRCARLARARRSRALAARPGTFTPICLVFLYNSGVGWAIWGTLWFLTAGGIALTVSAFDHLPKCGAFSMLRQARAHACFAGGCR